MTRSSPWVGLAVLAVGLLGASHAGDESPDIETGDCGELALYQLLQMEGRPVSLDQIRKALPVHRAAGCSLLELRRAAAFCGLQLDAVVLPRRRSAMNGPTLLFLKLEEQGHFVVARPVGHTGTLVQVLDGDREPAVYDAERLLDSPSWTGIALEPHRTNYIALLGVGISTICLVALGILRLSRQQRPKRLSSIAGVIP